MAQHDYVIANGTGAAVRSDLNNALAAIVSQNSGATAPATTYAYMPWADSTTGLYKIRNAANNGWITLYQLDGEWSTLAVENGTAAAPSIYFKDSGTATGIYSPGTDQVAISTGGTVRLSLSTTAVSSALAIDHPLGAVGTPSITFTGDLNTGIYSPGADQVAISTNGTQRLTVDTAATTSTLPVVHPLGAVGTPSITFTGDLNTGIYSPAADTIAFVEGGVEAMRIDSSGRLLVGTSTAGSVLTKTIELASAGTSTSQPAYQVFAYPGSSAADCGYYQFYRSRGATVGTNTIVASGDRLGMVRFNGANGTGFDSAAEIYAEVDGTPGASNDMPGRLVFSTTADGASSPTERMRIASDGATTVGAGRTGSTFTVSNTSTAASNVGTFSSLLGGSQSANNANCWHLQCVTQGTGFFYLYGNGTSSFTSDARKKKNIETTRDGYLEDLSRLRVVKYNWFNQEDGDPKELGLIAQEVEQVFPGLVQDGGKLEGDDFNCKVLKGSVLPFMLLKALQEATARIETLEAEVAALKAS